MEIPAQPPVQPPVQPPAQTPIQQPPIQQPTPPIQQSAPPIQPIPQMPPSSPPTMTQSTPPSSPKSQKGSYAALALIILTIIFGIAVYLMKGPSPSNIKNTANSQPTTDNKLTQTNPVKNSSALPPGNNDSQLGQDIQTLNASMDTLLSELNNVDQGLNDQSVNLTE